MRDVVAEGDRAALLDRARAGAGGAARTCRPRSARPDELAEVRVPVPDRPGVLAEVTTLATELDVNIADLEIAHSSEGDRGVLILLVEAGARRAVPRRADRRAATGRRCSASDERRAARDPVRCRAAARPPTVAGCPGSKSITNRALVCAALADGRRARCAACCSPTTPRRCSACSHALGVGVDIDRDAEPRRRATARGGGPGDRRLTLDARLSGTTARFLLPCWRSATGAYRLDGDPQLRARPMGRRSTRCAQLGGGRRRAAPPATCRSTVAAGRLPGRRGRDRRATCRASSSPACCSPAPCLPDGLVVERDGAAGVAALRRHDRRGDGAFGAPVERRRPHLVVAHRLPRPRRTRSSPTPAPRPTSSRRPRSPAAGSRVAGPRPRARCRATWRSSTCSSGWAPRSTGRRRDHRARHRHVCGRHRRRPRRPLRHRPDAGRRSPPSPTARPDRPASGSSARKETDRIARWSPSCARCGIDADGASPTASSSSPGTAGRRRSQTYDDHRMAMSFALLGLRAPGIAIADPGCVAKTFPGYWAGLDELRGSPADGTVCRLRCRVIAIDGPAGLGQVHRRPGARRAGSASSTSTPAPCTGRSPSPPCGAASTRPRPSTWRGSWPTSSSTSSDDGVTVDGVDATIEIRGPEVTRAVSIVAANPAVRDELRRRQREWAESRGGGVHRGPRHRHRSCSPTPS